MTIASATDDKSLFHGPLSVDRLPVISVQNLSHTFLRQMKERKT